MTNFANELTMKIAILVLFLFLTSSLTLCFSVESISQENDEGKPVHPVILMPGLAASTIEGKFDKDSSDKECKLKQDWHKIWFDKREVDSKGIECFKENFKRDFNKKTGSTSNIEGVETKVSNFGSDTFDFVFENTKYFGPLIESLLKNGYEKDVSIKGAPYDMRTSPYEMEEYFLNLKKLIEETFQQNYEKSIIILGHSTGAVYSLLFLKQQSQEWKDKYIKSMINLAPVFGGTIESLLGITIGSVPGIPFFNKKDLMELDKSFSSLYFFLPDERVYGKNPIISLQTKDGEKKLKAYHMKKIFDLMGDKVGRKMWEKSMEIIADKEFYMKNPGIKEITCLFGKGVPTPQELFFSETGFPHKPIILEGDGDGTVNFVSHEVCLNWAAQGITLNYSEVGQVNHIDIPGNNTVVDYVVERIDDLNKK